MTGAKTVPSEAAWASATVTWNWIQQSGESGLLSVATSYDTGSLGWAESIRSGVVGQFSPEKLERGQY